ncbi:MAG TPA: FUSC family protein [Acidimicrobiales bacterium]|nr:FUSC family protein [Acidimicrobiales bacterium]
MSRLGAALRHNLRLDAQSVAPIVGAITAAPVVALFAVGLSLSSTTGAIAMAVGANLVAIVSLVGAPRISLPLAIGDALAMGASAFVGTASAGHPALHVALLVPWCFCAGLLVAFGQTQAAIGSQAIIAFTVLGRFSGSLSLAAHLSLLVTLGALVEVVALVVLRLPPSLRHQRHQLARACEAVAALARSSPETTAISTLGVVDEVEADLDRPTLFGRRDATVLRSIFNQVRRARLELTTLAGLRARLDPHSAAATQLRVGTDVIALALGDLANRLRGRGVSGDWADYGDSMRRVLASLDAERSATAGGEAVLVGQGVDHLRAMAGQLRSAWGMANDPRVDDGRRAWRAERSVVADGGVKRLDSALDVLRSATSSMTPALRHAIRLSVAVPASVVLAHWWGLPRGYWLPFAVTVILKPDYSTLLRYGVGRVIGTLLGATASALLISGLHPDAGATAVLVALFAWAAYTTWSANFALSIGFVTALILVLLSTSLQDPFTTALDRLVEISLGAGIAAAAYLLWPTPPRAGVVEAEGALYASLARYWFAVSPLLVGESVERNEVTTASREARVAWGRAEAAVGRSVIEPRSTRLAPTEGQGLLAAALRLLRATHALRIDAERGATTPMSSDLAQLTSAIGASLQRLSDLLASEDASAGIDLRSLYVAAEASLVAAGAPESIAVHLDEMVNATNTARHLVRSVLSSQ